MLIALKLMIVGIQNQLPDLIKRYGEKYIFNADETGLFYNLLPSSKQIGYLSLSKKSVKGDEQCYCVPFQMDLKKYVICFMAKQKKFPLL